MQKKELRKSWRRKLAGLLAGTLIAGVFGISMPMTAQAATPGKLTVTVDGAKGSSKVTVQKGSDEQDFTSTGSIEIAENDVITLSAAADSTSQLFRGFSNDYNSHNVTKDEATDGIDVTATFVDAYPFTYSVSPDGAGSIDVDNIPPSGELVGVDEFTDSKKGTLTPVAAQGFLFKEWNIVGASQGADYTINDANVVTFKKMPEHSVSAEAIFISKPSAYIEGVTSPDHAVLSFDVTADEIADDGYSRFKEVTYINDGDEDIVLTFAYTGNVNGDPSLTINAKSSGVLEVWPKEGLKKGSYKGTVRISKMEVGGKTETNVNYTEYVDVTITVTDDADYTMDADKSVIDFSEQIFGQIDPATVKDTVEITNNGNQVMTLDVSGAESFDVTVSKDTLQPGETSKITVAAKEDMAVYKYVETLTVSNGTVTKEISVTLEVVDASQEIAVAKHNGGDTKNSAFADATAGAPKAIDFGTVFRNPKNGSYEDAAGAAATMKEWVLYVGNKGNVDVSRVTASVPSGGTNYIIAVNPYTAKVPRGTAGAVETDFAKITIEARTKLAVGTYNETLTISNGVEGDEIQIPVKFEIKEHSYTFEAKEVKTAADPTKDAAITEIDFGTAEVDYTSVPAEKTIRIINTGNSTFDAAVKVEKDGTEVNYFTITDKTISGVPASPEAEQKEGKTFTIQPDASTTKAKAGDYSATLVISNDYADPISIPVKFTVAEATQEVNVNGGKTDVVLDFGTVIAEGYKVPDAKEITIKNAGNTAFKTVSAEPQLTKFTLEKKTKDANGKTITPEYPDITADLKRSGETGDTTVYTLKPNADLAAGTHEEVITLTNGKTKGTDDDYQEIKVTAKIVVEKAEITAEVTPDPVDFEPLAKGYGANDITKETVTIKNTSNKKIKLGNPTATGTSPFTVGAFKKSELAVGESTTFTLEPKTGQTKDSVTKFSIAIENAEVTTGGTKGKVEFEARLRIVDAVRAIEVTPTPIALKGIEKMTAAEATSKAVEVTVTNTGNIAETISKPAAGTFYNILDWPTAGGKLAAGESLTFKVAPRNNMAASEEGYTGKLTLSNGLTGANKVEVSTDVTLTIEKRKTEAKATPATLDFGTYNKMKAAPAAKTVTVENTGNGEITLTQPTATMFEIGDLDKTVIQGGEKATFTVVPKADIKVGEQKETITIKGSNGMTDLTVEATVNVTNTGWKKENDGWYYYKDGVAAKGWLKTGGKWYFLDKSTGLMQTGWLKDDGKWYYLKASGAMANNEWVKDAGKYYFFKSGGAMASAQWVSWKGAWYYMNTGGSMKTEAWVKSAGKWYYMGKDGKMVKSTSVTVKGKTYNFDKNGVCTNP